MRTLGADSFHSHHEPFYERDELEFASSMSPTGSHFKYWAHHLEDYGAVRRQGLASRHR